MFPHAVLFKSLVDIAYLQLAAGSGEEQNLTNKPKARCILGSETDRQSNSGFTGCDRHSIKSTLNGVRVFLSLIDVDASPYLMVSVRRQADPSPPTLKPHKLLLIDGLLVL